MQRRLLPLRERPTVEKSATSQGNNILHFDENAGI
jgi:hypothetical protein